MNHLVSLVKFKLFISCFLSAVFLGFRTILNAFLNVQQLMANYFPWKMNWATCRKYETEHMGSPQDSTQLSDPIWHCYLWANKTLVASWPMFSLAGKPLKAIDSCAAVTHGDEHWPLFHFWRHYLWPKLAHLYLSSAGGGGGGGWGGDLSNNTHSDRTDGAWDMLKKSMRNLSEKLAAKFPATTLRYSMVKMFSQKFLNWKQAQ